MKYQTFIRIYDTLNQTVFANLLVRPVIVFTRGDYHAQFVNATHHYGRGAYMQFNPADIKGIAHATAIIYHEMIHQYVEEYLELDEDDHHGPIFWRNYKLFAPAGVELGESL